MFDFVKSVLLAERHAPDAPPALPRQCATFARKFQQVTAPVMAKGVEDTAFYIYNRLVSLNDVGGEPATFGVTVERIPRRERGSRQQLAAHDARDLDARQQAHRGRARAHRRAVRAARAWRLQLRRWAA